MSASLNQEHAAATTDHTEVDTERVAPAENAKTPSPLPYWTLFLAGAGLSVSSSIPMLRLFVIQI